MKKKYTTVHEFVSDKESMGHYLLGENFVWEALSIKGLVKIVGRVRTVNSGYGNVAIEGEGGELLFDKRVIESAYKDYLEEMEMEEDREEWLLEQF